MKVRGKSFPRDDCFGHAFYCYIGEIRWSVYFRPLKLQLSTHPCRGGGGKREKSSHEDIGYFTFRIEEDPSMHWSPSYLTISRDGKSSLFLASNLLNIPHTHNWMTEILDHWCFPCRLKRDNYGSYRTIWDVGLAATFPISSCMSRMMIWRKPSFSHYWGSIWAYLDVY